MKPQGHSPLGASGTHRWMECPGSVGLSEGIEDPESEHAAIGTAAHKVGETCLRHGGDAWHYLGYVFLDGVLFDIPTFDSKRNAKAITARGILVDKPMADAVQEYLDALRAWHPDRHQGNTWYERDFHCPEIHELFYGTSDCIHWDEAAATLHVWDYKNGAGIVVEVEDNPQLKYYAIGALEDLGLWRLAKKVVLHVAQPNGFHSDGAIRHWETTPQELDEWCFNVLVPAMDNALVSRDTESGDHCRFCPARRAACPQLEKDMDELEAMMKQMDAGRGAPEMTGEQIARMLSLLTLAKIKAKAAEEEAFKRLNAGKPVPGYKLAAKRANREWKDGVEAEAKKTFGAAAYTEPKLKSPAQIDALPKGLAFTAQYAAKPNTGLTVVPADDTRAEVSKSVKSMFKDQTKKTA
jgi:hypothetical protein